MGARFEYEGLVYVKTGPLTAVSETGVQRIIPRYASLRALLDVPVESGVPIKERIEAARVRVAFDRYYEISQRLADESGRAELALARLSFLEAIK